MKAIILRAAALTAATSTLLSAAGPEAMARPRGDGPDGAPGLGDRYFPRSGNGGYDVRHYDVTMAFTPRGGRVAATVAVTARALQDLRAFDLDFRGPTVESITVGGRPAGFRRSGQELIVKPETTLAAGTTFTTVVRYSGTPRRMHNRDLGSYGWVRSRDGALALGEPDGAQSWLPSNDHPRDKATYDVRVTVPNGLQVIGNGVPDPPERGARTTTYTWHERHPMASYLATVAIGRFRILTGRAGGIPVLTAVDPRYARHARRVQATTIKAIRLESRLFGPYPFASAGAIIDDPKVGYALETQERPVYAGLVPDESFIVHEIAHQWFGDSVGLTRWRDIWLNEGLATYAEWLWDEKVRHRPARVRFRRYYMQPARSAIFSPPPGRPGARRMFAFSVYLRGAMTLQALRNRVGDRAFFRTLRHWASEHRYGHGTTAQFIALAKREARGRVPARRIDRLFRAWLYRKGKPTSW